MKKSFLFILFVLSFNINAQINVVKNGGSISKNEQQAFELFKSYMQIGDDRKEGQKFWNTDKNFASYDFLFSEGFWNPNLYAYIYQANILSVTDTGAGSKIIRVLMSPSDKADNIYAIVNYVFKDNKLSNYTDFYTEKWTKRIVGNIEYHFPSDYSFNSANAKQANIFVNKLQDIFKLDNHNKLHYYIAKNCKEVRTIQGFDYVLGEGQSDNCAFFDSQNKIIYTTTFSGENHKHELIHLINIKYPNAHFWLTSGFSVYNNSDNAHIGKSLAWHCQKISDFIKEHPDFNFLDEEKEIKLEKTSVDYFVGTALIHLFLNKYTIEDLGMIMEKSSEKGFFEKNYYLFGATSVTDLNSKIKDTIKELSNPKAKLMLDLN
ncbi:hypothetical protein HZQ12_15625 [Elizabethkingia anophelis]|uniref:hypothetical protein n=1 Tax=Elizabethkingia anophelis TaxID=1117645 RepID=UPI000B35B9A9|nr:hypothetical protein [Elizabethkingia anophelis]MCT3835176.1 hypothetical protein [Elizabethkingia anophelis]MCT3978330.1 hypothetical protein [Elizabethkingia anophelis]MCT4042128.1 hypothetical protein [Elizabethkingia anophelis]MCT4324084.1 hypothetical protein [Elizabethkingia anophelis]HAY3536640.1 hypothetical protein [Elizabethkingia anophelis]